MRLWGQRPGDEDPLEKVRDISPAARRRRWLSSAGAAVGGTRGGKCARQRLGRRARLAWSPVGGWASVGDAPGVACGGWPLKPRPR